jgi:hypothetical protein
MDQPQGILLPDSSGRNGPKTAWIEGVSRLSSFAEYDRGKSEVRFVTGATQWRCSQFKKNQYTLMKTFILHAMAVVSLASCATGPSAQTGSVIGGLTGAAAGGIIGNQSGRGLEGAAIGAGLGALAGNAIGNSQDQRRWNNGYGYGPYYGRGYNPGYYRGY